MSETPPLVAAIEMFTHNVMLMKHFPIIGKLARKLPDSLASMIAPGYIVFRQVNPPSVSLPSKIANVYTAMCSVDSKSEGSTSKRILWR